MEEKTFLTAKEVAERLRVHPNTIYRMVKLGRLKGYSGRGRLYFRREDINSLLKGYYEGENPD